MRLLWIADELRTAGLTVVETAGWKTRGADVDPQVIVVHHTASRPPANAPSLRTVIEGRTDVPGPLCNVLVGRDGVAHVIASGRSNNAGTGSWNGITGNEHTFGIELENDGVGEPWGAARSSGVVVAAVVAHRLGLGADRVVGHKEWAPRRKIDPSFDMDTFRGDVAETAALPLSRPPTSPGGDVLTYSHLDGQPMPLAVDHLLLRPAGALWGGARDGHGLYAWGAADPAHTAADAGWRAAFHDQPGHTLAGLRHTPTRDGVPDPGPFGVVLVRDDGAEYSLVQHQPVVAGDPCVRTREERDAAWRTLASVRQALGL